MTGSLFGVVAFVVVVGRKFVAEEFPLICDCHCCVSHILFDLNVSKVAGECDDRTDIDCEPTERSKSSAKI